MRISFLAPYRTLLSGMNDTSESIARDQSQLSSGQAVTRPSQDVAQSSTILATRRELARRQQYGKNAAGAVALIGSSLNATAKIQDMLSQVTTLAVRARSALGTTAMQGVTAEISLMRLMISSILLFAVNIETSSSNLRGMRPSSDWRWRIRFPV